MKRVIWIITAFIAAIICFLAITYSKRDKELISTLRTFLDKEIVFPDYDSTDIIIGDSLFEAGVSDYMIVRCVDSAGCSKCKLQLGAFIDFMNDINAISRKNVRLVFILNQKSNNYAKLLFDGRSDIIVINDKECLFYDMNGYPKKEMFNTFLFKCNKIMTIGNPVGSSNIKENYYRIILGNE